MERARRLRKGTEFDRVYREGTVISGPLLVVRISSNDLAHPRWGFAVGKRIAPHASARNRAKRVLREAARGLDIQGSWDCIVTARPAALTATVGEARIALSRALQKKGIASGAGQ